MGTGDLCRVPLAAFRHGISRQTSGSGPSASCGYCCPLCPSGGSVPKENSFYRPQGWKWAQLICVVVPLAEVHHGRARQTSGTRPCGNCKRVLWVPGSWGQYLEKIRLIERHGLPYGGGGGVAMLLNVVLTSGKPTRKSNFRDRT